MSELRTPDQILKDTGIDVEDFKKNKELLYICVRRAMDDFAEQYHYWKEKKTFFNFVDKHYSHASENYREELKESFGKYLKNK